MTHAPFTSRFARPVQPARSSAALQAAGDPFVIAFFYAVIFTAAFNTVLRVDLESSVTLYYMATPIVFALLLMFTNWFVKWAVFFIPVAVYGVIVAKMYGTPQDVYAPKLIFFLFLLVFMGVLRFLQLRDPRFDRNIMRCIWGLLILALGLAVLQAATGFRLPNVSPLESSYLTGYFFTANDIGLFVSAAATVIILRKGRFAIKAAAIAAVFFLNMINDAKAAILAVAIIAFVFYAAQMATRLRAPPLVVGGLAALLVVGIGVGGSAITFQVGAVEFDLYELIVEPLRRVVQLDAYNLRGSVYDRSDALIINLREFIGTVGLGMGPGGSTFVLSLPENRLVTAESMHNAVAELAVEMGIVFLIPLGWWVYKVCAPMMQLSPSRRHFARFAFLCGLPFLSVTQSSGYISNYAFWLTLYLIVFASEEFWGTGNRVAVLVRPARPQMRMPWETGRYIR